MHFSIRSLGRARRGRRRPRPGSVPEPEQTGDSLGAPGEADAAGLPGAAAVAGAVRLLPARRLLAGIGLPVPARARGCRRGTAKE